VVDARRVGRLGDVHAVIDHVHDDLQPPEIEELHHASESRPDDKGALGVVDAGRVVIHRRSERPRTFAVERLETRVPLLRLYLGFDVLLVEAALDLGARGLVLEAFGRGNGPAALVPVVRRAVAAGVAVVITSRCPTGRVEPIYGKGGGKNLAEAGAIFAGDLKGPKARLLLMVLLGASDTRSRIAEVFADLAP
jgi:L-asparaginase